MSDLERVLTGVVGGAVALYGVQRRSLLLVGLGGGLLGRAAAGYSLIYQSLGVSTRTEQEKALSIEHTLTVNRPPEDCYAIWRDLGRLPAFFKRLELIEDTGSTSRWRTKLPGRGPLYWEARIVTDDPGQRLAWRTLADSSINMHGEVVFENAPGERGTRLRLRVVYLPPGGAWGLSIASLLGRNPTRQIEQGLRRFKQVMETGEIATTDGQPSGRRRRRLEPGEVVQRTMETAAAAGEGFGAEVRP